MAGSILLFLLSFSFSTDCTQTPENPTQIRLSYTGNPKQLKFTWVTFNQQPTQLRIRKSGVQNWTLLYGQSNQFQEGPNKFQYIHSTTASFLQHNQQYEYMVGAYPFASQIQSILYQDHLQIEKVAAFGDWGVGPRGHTTLNLLKAQFSNKEYQAIFHFGDIAYNLQNDDGKLGDDFLSEIESITKEIPYMVGPGNHDNFNNFTQYINRFPMPYNKENQGTGLFYSLNLKYAHIVMINTEFYFYQGGDPQAALNQFNWLQKDLIQANLEREIRPWIVVMGHKPLYCSSQVMQICSSDAELLQSKFESLFKEQSVDLYFAGHLHYYQRTTPIFQNRTVASQFQDTQLVKDAGSTIYIVSGNAGSEQDITPIPSRFKDWSVYLNNTIGYGHLEFFNQTSMLWKQFDTGESEVIDYLYLSKSTPRPF